MNSERDKKQIKCLRKLKSSQRLKAAFQLYDFARSRIGAEIKRNNPGIAEGDLLEELNKRFIR